MRNAFLWAEIFATPDRVGGNVKLAAFSEKEGVTSRSAAHFGGVMPSAANLTATTRISGVPLLG